MTIDQDNFFVRVNGGDKFSKNDYIKFGNYNLMLRNCPLYEADKHSFAESQNMFRGVFKSGFAWEVLEVFSGNGSMICNLKKSSIYHQIIFLITLYIIIF